jgi:uncharacterized surface protein with fasciclin (FAS1) repeats
MKAVLLAVAISAALASEVEVPAGKAEIVTTDSDDCLRSGGKVLSKFQVDQDECYGLAAVPTSVVNVDQKVRCLDNGDFLIRTYESTDSSCSGLNYLHKFAKGSCISIDGLRGPVTVTCPESTATTTTSPEPKAQNIVELAESVKDLSTLVSAVVAGDLVDTLSSPGPFTVFAPTNDGFAALPAGTLDSLMKPENKAQLVDILTYHVLPIQAYADDLDLFQPTTTVEGKLLHVQKWGGVVKVGPSLKSEDLKTVIAADNGASNGVVHIIDGVLLPPSSMALV